MMHGNHALKMLILWCRYKVPNIKVPNHKIPNTKFQITNFLSNKDPKLQNS